MNKMIDETDLCIIEYERDEYDRGVGLVCEYNHSENGICLFDYCDACRKLSDECHCYDERPVLTNK